MEVLESKSATSMNDGLHTDRLAISTFLTVPSAAALIMAGSESEKVLHDSKMELALAIAMLFGYGHDEDAAKITGSEPSRFMVITCAW